MAINGAIINDINAEPEQKACTICNGDGKIFVLSKEKIPTRVHGVDMETMKAIPCLCRLNQRVEDRYPCFKSIPDADDKFIDAVLKKWNLNDSYVLTGNAPRFYRIMKAVFVHLSRHSAVRFHIGNGFEIIKENYLHQEGSLGPDILDLARKWHFIAIKFESRTVNKAMQSVLADLVQARALNNLPTWVWSDRALDAYQEYSAEMQTVLDAGKFTRKSLVPATPNTSVSGLLNAGGANA